MKYVQTPAQWEQYNDLQANGYIVLEDCSTDEANDCLEGLLPFRKDNPSKGTAWNTFKYESSLKIDQSFRCFSYL